MPRSKIIPCLGDYFLLGFQYMEKIIIFDYDGVIVDSLDAYEDAVLAVFKKHGITQINSRETFLDLFEDNFFASAKKLGVSSEKMPEIVKELEPELISLQSNLRLFDGMREMLGKLAGKCRLYIVTSNLSSVVEAYLKSQNISGFEEIIGAEKETSKAKKIEAIKAKYPKCEIFYVGDTKGDMIEGKKAGAKTIGVAWGWHGADRLKEGEPDYIAEKPGELLEILDVIE